MSLESELGLIDQLLRLSKRCSSPTLKALAPELKVRKRTLKSELQATPELRITPGNGNDPTKRVITNERTYVSSQRAGHYQLLLGARTSKTR
jgi:hypothetical protein